VTDFPRGWTQSLDGAGGATTSITLPAIAGVAHVLDSFSATAQAFGGAAAFAARVRISTSDGTFNNMVLARLQTPAPVGGNPEGNTASGSELGLVGGVGASMTVAFDVGGAQVIELLVIQGHDI
jgi:hypothetical protein